MINFGNSITRCLPWTTLKSLVDSKGLALQFDEDPSKYTLFTIDGSLVDCCVIYKQDPDGISGYDPVQNSGDLADFETNYRGSANQRITPKVEKDSRTLLTASIYSAIDDSGKFLGDQFIASGHATTIHDFKLDYDYRLQGAHWWVRNCNWGDTADFSVVDKDNIFGLFEYYGLQEGDVLELKKYVNHIPMPPIDACCFLQDAFAVDNPAFICSGLYLRCIYDNRTDEDAYIGITYVAYQE